MGSIRCRMEDSGSVTKLHRARADSLRAAGVPMASNLSSHLSRNPSSSCSPVVEARPGPRRGSWGPVASQNCRNQSGVCSRARAYTVTASAETHHCGVGLPCVSMYRQHLTTVARARTLCTTMGALWVWGFAGICSNTGRAAWERHLVSPHSKSGHTWNRDTAGQCDHADESSVTDGITARVAP